MEYLSYVGTRLHITLSNPCLSMGSRPTATSESGRALALVVSAEQNWIPPAWSGRVLTTRAPDKLPIASEETSAHVAATPPIIHYEKKTNHHRSNSRVTRPYCVLAEKTSRAGMRVDTQRSAIRYTCPDILVGPIYVSLCVSECAHTMTKSPYMSRFYVGIHLQARKRPSRQINRSTVLWWETLQFMCADAQKANSLKALLPPV